MNLDSLFYIPEKSWYELQGWAKLAHNEDKNERIQTRGRHRRTTSSV